MINSFSSVFTIFIMIGIGYILASKGVLNKETNKLFSKLVVTTSLPLMMISSIPNRFTLEKLLGSSKGLIVAFLSMIVTYGVAVLVSYILKIEKSEKGIFYAMFTFPNAIFIGLPINVSMYGEESATYVFLYYAASTILFWTLAVYNVRKSSKNYSDNFTVIERIKKVFSPPLIGFIIGILLVVFRIELPEFLISSFRYIGGLTTPLSMLFIGTVIYYMDFQDIKLDITSNTILLGRFLISPIVMMLCLRLFSLPDLLNKVFVIESAAPIITQIALVSDYYETNSKYVSIMVGFSTMLSMIIIPIYAFVLN